MLHLAGIIAEVTTVLAAEGIAVCSCVVRAFTLKLTSKHFIVSKESSYKSYGLLQAEIDRGRGLAVMLFQIEANFESLVIRPIDLNSFNFFFSFSFWIFDR